MPEKRIVSCKCGSKSWYYEVSGAMVYYLDESTGNVDFTKPDKDRCDYDGPYCQECGKEFIPENLKYKK